MNERSRLDLPADWEGRHVPLMDVLLHLRARVAAGFALELLLGELDVFSFWHFVNGLDFHTVCCGTGPGARYLGFKAWLRETSDWEPSALAWPHHVIELTRGDHRAAIVWYLNKAGEYAALGP